MLAPTVAAVEAKIRRVDELPHYDVGLVREATEGRAE